MWLLNERGLAWPSNDVHLLEARHILAWQFEQYDAEGLMDLRVIDIYNHKNLCALKLTRSSLKTVAARLRSLLHLMYRAGHIATGL